MTAEIEDQLTVLEPLRKGVGPLAKGLMLGKLWAVRMGLALVASVAIPFVVVWFASKNDAMPPAYVALAVLGMFLPLGVGLASVLPTTFRVFSAKGTDADEAYRQRFNSDVLQPLLRRVAPSAVVDFDGGIDRTLFDGSGVYASTGPNFRAPFRITGHEGGVAWTAGPVKEWDTAVNSSDTGGARTRAIVIHDGLFAWTATAGLPRAVLVADRQSGDEAFSRAHALRTLIGRRPDAPSTGDAAFDAAIMVLSEDQESVSVLTTDIRRALLDAVRLVGTPVRIALGPSGVGMAFPGRGRLTGVAASADIQQLVGFTSGPDLVSAAAAALEADAALLRAVPQALAGLRAAVEEASQTT